MKCDTVNETNGTVWNALGTKEKTIIIIIIIIIIQKAAILGTAHILRKVLTYK
jgi:hypothetical protein